MQLKQTADNDFLFLRPDGSILAQITKIQPTNSFKSRYLLICKGLGIQPVVLDTNADQPVCKALPEAIRVLYEELKFHLEHTIEDFRKIATLDYELATKNDFEGIEP